MLEWAKAINKKDSIGGHRTSTLHMHRTSDDDRVERERREDAHRRGITILGRM
jgi:hypothetical protein